MWIVVAWVRRFFEFFIVECKLIVGLRQHYLFFTNKIASNHTSITRQFSDNWVLWLLLFKYVCSMRWRCKRLIDASMTFLNWNYYILNKLHFFQTAIHFVFAFSKWHVITFSLIVRDNIQIGYYYYMLWFYAVFLLFRCQVR